MIAIAPASFSTFLAESSVLFGSAARLSCSTNLARGLAPILTDIYRTFWWTMFDSRHPVLTCGCDVTVKF